MNAKLLVADESPTIHKIVAMAFEKDGLTVEGISRGEHVLEYMVEFKPDVVLADIHLPGLDGYQISGEIKKSEKFSSTRVILLTSDFEDVDEDRLKQSQADDTISKPFKSEEIRKKVKAQLERAEKETASPALETIEEQPALEETAPQENAVDENEIIEREFEDIVRQTEKSIWDPREPELITIEEKEEPSVEKPAANQPDLPLEGIGQPEPAPSAPEEPSPPVADETQESPTQAAPAVEPAPAVVTPPPPVMDEESVHMMAEVSEQAIREQSLPLEERLDDLNAVFESLRSASFRGEDLSLPQREPGSKPNLIEDAMALMAHYPPEPKSTEVPIPLKTEARASRDETGEELDIELVPDEARSAPDLSLGRRLVEAHVNQVKERLPEGVADAEVTASLERTVRQVLGEMGPEIVRKVIQEEIDAIKKMEEA